METAPAGAADRLHFPPPLPGRLTFVCLFRWFRFAPPPA